MTAADVDRLAAEVNSLMAKIERAVAVHKSNNDDADYDDVSSPSMDADDDDEEDEDDDVVSKAATASVYDLATNSDTDRPGALATSNHDSWRNNVQRAVDNVARAENCSKTEALRRLRERNVVSGSPVSKRVPDFETAVELEIAKGLNRECASVRVQNLYGSTLPRRLAKADFAEAEFVKRASALWDNSNLTACESLRAARVMNPKLFRRMQRA